MPVGLPNRVNLHMPNKRAQGKSHESGSAISSMNSGGNGADVSHHHPPSNGNQRASERVAEPCLQQRSSQDQIPTDASKPIRVMKFGGTSVADGSCIEEVVE